MRAVLDTRQRRILAVGIALSLLGAMSTLAQPLLVGRMIQALTAGGQWTGPLMLIVGVFVADLVLGTLSFYLIGRVGEHTVATMRGHFVSRIVRAPLGAFRQFPHGDLMTRGVADTAIARLALSSSLAQVITSAFTVLGCLTVMALVDWRLLLATLATLAVASVVCLALARRVHAQAAANRSDTAAFGDDLLRVISNVTTVKANTAEDAETVALSSSAEQARRSGVQVIGTSALLMPVMNVGTQLSLAIVIAWGTARTLSGDLSLAALSTFVMYVLYLVAPLVMLFLGFSELQQARAAMDRLDEVMALEPETGGSQSASAGCPTSLTLNDVTFAYPGADEPVLSGANLSLPTRGMTAIVGLSGAGKTTLFNLWERFYDPQEGVVTVAGTDCRHLPLSDLRSYVGLVEQDSPLMRGTIRSNLTYGNAQASDDQVATALDVAQLCATVDQLPEGLDTALGENGLGLSGGQKQRLAIARTLLREPRVLLLDEATANLDAESEFALNRALRAAARDRQVVVIAHRMSTARAADRIVIVQDGHIQDEGSHSDLYHRNAAYRTLADNQLRDVHDEHYLPDTDVREHELAGV